MARVWHHWPNGVQTEWAAGTLPAGESVFRADFLNQFVSWIRYLAYIQAGGVEPSTPAWVEPGDNVQSAAFWNGLIFAPEGNSMTAPALTGWEYGHTAAEWSTVGAILSGYAALTEAEDYAAHPVATISAGDNLQAILRAWLANLRWRLDNCTTFHQWSNRGNAQYRGTMRTDEWSTYDGGRHEYEEDGSTDWITPAVFRNKATSYPYTNYSTVWSVRDVGIYGALKCRASLWCWRDGGADAPDYLPFPYPPAGQAEIYAASDTLPANLYPGPMPEYGPYYADTNDVWGTQGEFCLIPFDDLPAEFQPPE